MTHHEHADLDKHSDQELRDAIAAAEEQDERLELESSEAALEAQRGQRSAIEEELERRRS